jgi:hypothetical protein
MSEERDRLPDSNRALLEILLAQTFVGQDRLRRAIEEGAVIELHPAGNENCRPLVPISASVDINCANAAEALCTVGGLSADCGVIVVRNALQAVIETRQFLNACFSKLAVGGFLVVIVPHQFMYERKLRLPSLRNSLHRRFYTPGILLADIEEAIDPCEYRVRFLGENDEGYDYLAPLGREPAGRQDIVVAIEKIAPPPWRHELEGQENWSVSATTPTRYVPINRGGAVEIRAVVPDSHEIQRIMVLKLDHRGDFLMADEAFRILRSSFPAADITIACGSWNRAEAEACGHFNRVVAFDFFPEDDSARLRIPPREALVEKFRRQIAGTSFDLAIDFRLFEDTRDVLRVVEARHHAGFDRRDFFPWLSIRLQTPSGTADDRAEQAVITAEWFQTCLAPHRTYEIVADESLGSFGGRSLIWGPYSSLKPGAYEFECLIEPLGEESSIRYDIAVDSGRRKLCAGFLSLRRDEHPKFCLQIDENLDRFEFRLYRRIRAVETKPFRFLGLRYVRQGVFRAMHQSEAMALLAHLAALRLRNAFTTEVL